MNLIEDTKEIINNIPQDTENLKVYSVGGAVRDSLLGEDYDDIDFVVVEESEESMKERGFHKIDAQSFPVFHDERGNEYSLARREKSTGDGYHDFEVETEQVSLEADLRRRDLTVNSMCCEIDSQNYHFPLMNNFDEDRIRPEQPINPIKDLDQKVLRHTTQAFREDPVRVLRLARFAARKPEFEIADETIELAQATSARLEDVPGERIGDEIHKAMKQAENPRRFWEVCMEIRALHIIAPELVQMRYVSAGPEEHHGEGDLWTHTLMVLDEMAEIDVGNHDKMMMALVHDIGKLKTYNEENTGGHDKLGVEIVEDLVERWRLSNEYEEKMKDACREHMRVFNVDPGQESSMRESKVIELVQRLDGSKGATQEELIDLAKADNRGRDAEVEISDSTFGRIEERLEKAREAVETVDAQYVADQRDKEIDDFDSGEALGQTITNDRVHYMKKLQGENE
jgi:tRNA nucleotidyltransferase (CCA-adding enzyme)